MGVEFMVLGAPRSGTAWAANWLTTDATLCLHDPLWGQHYRDLDAHPTRKTFGVACTGLAMFPEWTNAHRARKVILHRDLGEVNASLERIGMPAVPESLEQRLQAIDGLHVSWTDLFEKPAAIFQHLLPQFTFDPERHAALRNLEVQTRFEGIQVDRAVTARLLGEMHMASAAGVFV